MQGCTTSSRRLKFFVNLIQSSFGAMLMIYFFLHTSLVHSLSFYFCAYYFGVLLSKWLCVHIFLLHYWSDFLCIYSIVSASHDCIFKCTYSIVTASHAAQVWCTNTSTGKELIPPTSLGQGCEMLTFVFDQLSKLLLLFSLFDYYSLGQGCEMFTFLLDQLKF